MPVSNWSTTAASNGATLGIDIAENCDAANVNNAMREMMAQLKTKLDAMDALITANTLDALLTSIAGLTFGANNYIYGTGSDTAAVGTISSFGRSLVDDGDAATARTTLGALGLTSATFSANTIALRFTLSDGTTLLIQGGTGSIPAESTATITFATAYSVAPVCVVNGGPSNPAQEGDVHASAAATTTGIAICNSDGSGANTYTYLAIGKL